MPSPSFNATIGRMSKRSNQEWLEDLAGAGREAAIADLRELLLRGLRYTLASRVDSNLEIVIEDFAQDALLKVLDNIETFRGESQFTTWAQKIAARVAFTELRRKRWKDTSLESLATSKDGTSELEPRILADDAPSPENITSRHGMIAVVHRLIIEELTEKQREAILNVMVYGIPLEELAVSMETNRNALYKLIHDARVRLKQRLEAEGLTPEDVLAAF